MPADATSRGPVARFGAVAGLSGLAALFERMPGSGRSLAILTYHRVAPDAERADLHPGLAVEPKAFEAQMELIATRADPVTLADIEAAAAGGARLPRRAVHVTFDDAYEAIERHAWPVLRRLGVPATMFVPTSYPDQPRTFWWDRLANVVLNVPGPHLVISGEAWAVADDGERLETFAALRKLVSVLPIEQARTLVDEVAEVGLDHGVPGPFPATSSWAGLRSMAAEGLALGAHSRSHPFLTKLTPDELDDEIGGSVADLGAATSGPPSAAFAYPSGAYDDAVVDATKRADIAIAVTTDRGVVDLRRPDWLRLPRINVGRRATPALVRIQLTPAPHAARNIGRSVSDLVRAPGARSNRRQAWN